MAESYTLSSIYTYPIKSCASIAHTEVALDARGPVWDRRWMVVDPDGMFLTQRELPRLALVQPSFAAEALCLSAPDMPDMAVTLHYALARVRQVEVWNDSCRAWDEGDAVAQWFSDYLNADVRLVRMADDFVRRVDERYAPQPAQTGFTDGYPLLIVSEASVDELNRHMDERGKPPVPMSRFRPNLVVSGAEAFAEDGWRTIQIGGVTLDVVKSCARCATTTVDQSTGTVPDVTEPLATLNTFRKVDGKVLFAQNAIHRAPGTLRVGDAIEVLA